MSTTLTYGLVVPADGETGVIVFPFLEADIRQIDAHTHDGVTSPRLTRIAITSITALISNSNWSATSGGTYRQLVTMPAGLSYGDVFINFILTSAGHQIFPTVEKVSGTSYYVYTNDNSLDYTAVYG